jgi:pimeloyl-ACP methyl ester carboxylesterase
MIKKTLVILHGWQSKVEKWSDFRALMEKQGWKVFLPSLPGFGENKLKKPWNLNNYVDWFNGWLKKKKITKFCLLGHSFGGRISIKYAANKPKELGKIILIGCAGFEKRATLKNLFFLIMAKAGKILFFLPPFCFLKSWARWLLYKLAGEKDYFEAGKNLKETMKKVIGQNLTKEIKKINNSTLIIWGREDKITPLKYVGILKKGIAKNKILVYDNSGHNLPFTKSRQLTKDVCKFCQND